jgi:hypothetical protein
LFWSCFYDEYKLNAIDLNFNTDLLKYSVYVAVNLMEVSLLIVDALEISGAVVRRKAGRGGWRKRVEGVGIEGEDGSSAWRQESGRGGRQRDGARYC